MMRAGMMKMERETRLMYTCHCQGKLKSIQHWVPYSAGKVMSVKFIYSELEYCLWFLWDRRRREWEQRMWCLLPRLITPAIWLYCLKQKKVLVISEKFAEGAISTHSSCWTSWDEWWHHICQLREPRGRKWIHKWPLADKTWGWKIAEVRDALNIFLDFYQVWFCKYLQIVLGVLKRF